MSAVCNNIQCKFRRQDGGFCSLDFTFLNSFGQCRIWFDKNGMRRPGPEYPFDPPEESTEQETAE